MYDDEELVASYLSILVVEILVVEIFVGESAGAVTENSATENSFDCPCCSYSLKRVVLTAILFGETQSAVAYDGLGGG